MSATFLRLGLWTLIVTLALFVVDSTYTDSLIAELITTAMLQWFLVVGVALLAAGIVVRVLERGAKAVAAKNRCRVCKAVIPPGAIYCREHLRNVLELEDRRTHSTRLPKRFR